MNRTFADAAVQRDDIVCVYAFGKPLGAIDKRLCHRAARIGLERGPCHVPGLAELTTEYFEVWRHRRRKAVQESVRAFEHGCGSRKACLGHACRAYSRLRCPAGMHAFGPRAVCQILDDSGRHAARDTECVGRLLRRKAHCRSDAGRRAHGAQDGCWMKACGMHAFLCEQSEPTHELTTDCEPDECLRSAELVRFGSREYRGNDDRAPMHGTAFERVIEIFAVCRRAVDHGRARCIERGVRAEDRARTLRRP